MASLASAAMKADISDIFRNSINGKQIEIYRNYICSIYIKFRRGMKFMNDVYFCVFCILLSSWLSLMYCLRRHQN